MYVKVDDRIAVLKILALADAIRRNQKVKFPLFREILRATLRLWGKSRDDAREIPAESGQGSLIVPRPGHQAGVYSKFLLCPVRKLPVQILCGISEGGEYKQLSVPRIHGLPAFTSDNFPKCVELGIPRSVYLLCGREQRCKPVPVLDEVLTPSDTVNILQQHLDFPADKKTLKGGIINIDILNVDFLDAHLTGLELGQGCFDVGQLAGKCERERRDGAFHSL